MITTTAAYPAAPLDLPPLGQTGLTDASMNNNNNNNNNPLGQPCYIRATRKQLVRPTLQAKSSSSL